MTLNRSNARERSAILKNFGIKPCTNPKNVLFDRFRLCNSHSQQARVREVTTLPLMCKTVANMRVKMCTTITTLFWLLYSFYHTNHFGYVELGEM